MRHEIDDDEPCEGCGQIELRSLLTFTSICGNPDHVASYCRDCLPLPCGCAAFEASLEPHRKTHDLS